MSSENPLSSASAENPVSKAAALAASIPKQPEHERKQDREPKSERNASLLGDAWRELRRKPTFVLPTIWILIVLSMAVFPTLWTAKDYQDCDVHFAKLPMFVGGHWFGTNFVGCDYYAQAIYGAAPSLKIAGISTLGIVILGGGTGVLMGFFGGWVDALMSRIVDIFLSLPFLLGAIVFITVLKSYSVGTIASVLVILGWGSVARIMRGSVLAAKNLDFVHAARALGSSNSRLMFRHILPNAVTPVIVVATVSLGGFVTAEATLTFLGVGLKPPKDISWGMMISQHQAIFQDYPWLLAIPCVLLILTVLSFILVGDALRDALDPKLR